LIYVWQNLNFMQTVSREAISSSENFQIAADNVLNNDFLNSAI